MPVSTVTVVGHALSRMTAGWNFIKFPVFAVAKDSTYRVFCSCGAFKMSLQAKKHARYSVTVSCVFCGGSHTRDFSGSHLWSGSVIELFCTDTGLDLAHIGSAERVRRAASERVEGSG